MRWALVFAALASGCIQFDDELTRCRDNGGCGAQQSGGGGGGDAEDSGTEDGGQDAGPSVCPGAPGPLCPSNGFCQLSPSAPVDTFVDVFVDGRAAWAVGEGGLVACFDGNRWRYSQGVTRQTANAVMGDGDDSVTVVASDGTIRHWSYSALAWKPTEELPAPNNQSSVDDVWATPGYEIYAAGGTVCERRDGGYRCSGVIPVTTATAVAAASPQLFCSAGAARLNVAGLSGGSGYTVTGNGGTVAMSSICMWPDGGLIAAGSLRSPDGTVVARRSGGQFAESVRSGLDVTNVACASDSTFLLAEDGALFSCQALNACNQLQLAENNVAMYAVAERAGQLYGAGMAGVVQRGTAAGAWSRLTPAPLPHYHAVALAPDGGVYIVGGDCTLLRGEADGGFAPVPVAGCTGVDFKGIHFQPNGTGWLVGTGGNLYELASGTDTTSRAFDPSMVASRDFVAVAGNGDEVWAVGQAGLIAQRLSDAGWQLPTSSALDGGDFVAIAPRPDGGVTAATADEAYEFGASGHLRTRTLIGRGVCAVYVDGTGDTYVFGNDFTYRATATATQYTQLSNSPGGSFVAPTVESVCGSGTDVFVSDRFGRILRAVLSSSSVAYLEAASPTSVPLHGLACGPTTVTAVGAYGLIARGAR